MTMKFSPRQLAEVTAETSGTNYYYFSEVQDFNFAGFQVEMTLTLDTLTVTVEGTMDNDATVALASRSWQDITDAFFGVASITADGMLIFDTPCPFAALRIKTVSAGGNDDAAYNIYAIGKDS